jgi:hypothetical protein
MAAGAPQHYASQKVCLRVELEGQLVWTTGVIIEPDGDRWILAVRKPEGDGEPHIVAAGVPLMLVTGAASQLADGGTVPGCLDTLPDFRQIYRAYITAEGRDMDVEYLTASDADPPAEPPAAAGVRRSERDLAARLRQLQTTASMPRAAAGAATVTRSGLLVEDDFEDVEEPVGGQPHWLAALARQFQTPWATACGTAAGSAAGAAGSATAPTVPQWLASAAAGPWGAAAPGVATPARPDFLGPGAAPRSTRPVAAQPAAPSFMNPPYGGAAYGLPPASPWVGATAASAPSAPLLPSRPTAPAAGGAPDLNTLIQLEILRALQRGEDDGSSAFLPSSEGGAKGVAKSLKTLHQVKREIHTRPAELISEYIEKVKESMGVYPGQVWTLGDYNRRLPWGKHRSLQRCHFMMCEIFTLMDSGRSMEAQALVCQCMKSLHQTAIDQGDWSLSWHLSTLRDPFQRTRFGGSERELEAIASYTRAIDDLEQRMRKERGKQQDVDPGDDAQGQAAVPKAKGKGK